MRVITDFHLHSKYSRACSKDLTIPNIAKACERKGIQFVGTSDFTHPAWRAEIGRELTEDHGGTFRLKNGDSPTRFLLSTELSSIYKRNGKVRRVHHCVLMSSLDGVDRFISALNARGCNLKADGRPILGIDSEELLKMVMDADTQAMLIPAHAWTPWFAVFGSQSGFDSLEECFGEMTKYIPAIETGLSSNPKMNWRLKNLDTVFLVSNSDAHSLDKLGREANVFEMDVPSYAELRRILLEKDKGKFLETIEFFPEEGKYHADGHRSCKFSSTPKETKRLKGMCPVCGKPLTVGVLHRIDDLADREEGEMPPLAVPYRSIVPLDELVGSVLDVGASSKKVKKEIDRLVADGRSEFGVLLDVEKSELARVTSPEIVDAIMQMRKGEMDIEPGYDGEYGVIRPASDSPVKPKQQSIVF
ncbi:DNA helicase UvrD [Candidatus Uhrbacteria bacterium]|nr:DNA helicase UvrD [Candidatus Uhrbacteria bacterium]